MTVPDNGIEALRKSAQPLSPGSQEYQIRVGNSGLLVGAPYDDVQVTYPSTAVEVYEFYGNTLLVATIEVTYSDSSKANLVRAQRV